LLANIRLEWKIVKGLATLQFLQKLRNGPKKLECLITLDWYACW
jgi:hypothetical protein